MLSWLRTDLAVSLVLVAVGGIAVSRLPTFNGKTLKLRSEFILPFLAVTALVGGLLVIRPWLIYLVLVGIYVVSWPVSALSFYRRRKHYYSKEHDKVTASDQ